MYVHGGVDNAVYSDELWQYEIPFAPFSYYPSVDDAGNKWTLLTKSIKRAFHSLFYYNSQLYLYAGYEGTTFKDDMWRFDIATKVWT